MSTKKLAVFPLLMKRAHQHICIVPEGIILADMVRLGTAAHCDRPNVETSNQAPRSFGGSAQLCNQICVHTHTPGCVVSATRKSVTRTCPYTNWHCGFAWMCQRRSKYVHADNASSRVEGVCRKSQPELRVGALQSSEMHMIGAYPPGR